MPTTDEGGLRRTGVYWTTEVMLPDGTPVTPENPVMKLWSSTIMNEGGESSAEYDESLGISNATVTDKHHSVESHERTINYELCRFPVNAAGEPQDPIYYAGKRDIDHNMEATLTMLKVMKRASTVPNNTSHHEYFEDIDENDPTDHPSGEAPEAQSRASRTETYGWGGMPGEPEVSSNPGDNAVVTAEYGMQFGMVRKYQFDQPENEYIHVRSTDPNDTGLEVHLESADGSNGELLTTDSSDSTNATASTSPYDSLRVWVPGEFAGTLEIYADDGSGTDTAGAPGQLLTYIRGSNTYDRVMSDSGVPMIGSGSWEDESVLPDSISAVKGAGSFSGSPLAQKVMGSTITFSNNLDPQEPTETFAPDMVAGELALTCESTVYGETESSDHFKAHIEGREGELRIPTERGDFVFPRAYVESGGSTEQEEGSAVMQVDVGLKALQPTDGSDPVEFEHADA